MLISLMRIVLAITVSGTLVSALYRNRAGPMSVGTWLVLLLGAGLAGGAMWSLSGVKPGSILETVRRHRAQILGTLFEAIGLVVLLPALLPINMKSFALPLALTLVCLSRWSSGIALRGLFSFGVFGLLAAVGTIREYEITYGPLLMDTWAAVFQTSLEESFGYAREHFSTRPLWLAGACVLWIGFGAFAMRKVQPRPTSKTPRRRLTALAAGVAVVGFLGTWQPLQARVTEFNRSFATFRAEVEVQREILESLERGGVKLPPGASLAGFEGTVVLVLGEATTRRTMSLYGYHRDTTPRLEALGDELLVHRDTISPHSHTVPSLMEVLTADNFGEHANSPDLYSRSLLIELRRAGFKTWWLSNQNEFGAHDNPVSLLGKQANVTVFRRKSGALSVKRPYWDHELLPLLDKALNDPAPRRFIVLHLYAAHGPYCEMIPPEHRTVLDIDEGLGAKFFGNAKDYSDELNCYDNAVRYVDGIVADVADRVRAQNDATAMVYISDHGENAANSTGHSSGRHSSWHVEIPHLWVFNAAARNVLTSQVAALEDHLTQPFKSSDLFHVMLDLVGADSDLVDPTRSLFSNDYLARPRKTLPRRMQTAELGGAAPVRFVAYDERSPGDLKDALGQMRVELAAIRKETPSAYEKLWAHRTNSIGKLLETKEVMAGVEMDLTFDVDSGRFRVLHGGEKDVGLTLEELLHAAQDRPHLNFWLDWKNPKSTELDAALARLDDLDRRFSLKARALVETPSSASTDELRKISIHGYRHSHYLETRRAMRCSLQPDTADCLTLAQETLARVRNIGASTLSFDLRAWPFVQHHRALFAGVDLAAWDDKTQVTSPRFASQLAQLDEFVAMLVPFPSIYAR